MTSSSNTAEKLPALQIAHKRIRLKTQHSKLAQQIEREYSLSPVAARILAARKFEPGDDLEQFLNPTLRSGLPAPDELKNLTEACKLIREVVEGGGSIAIACDFDVDGLSGGAQVYHFLNAAGITAQVYVPNRFTEGYGLNKTIIHSAHEAGHALLLTIDYGTTNVAELELARSLGMKSIVVDHHHVHTPPPADVFINPQQQGCGFADGVLCAAGLAWYLIIALRKELPQAQGIDPKSYLDLACLGTICDMVPLKGPNRIIAKRGLELLETTERRGLKALKDVIGIKDQVRCSNVSFGIGPRLNAAGRMVDGQMVIKLLTTNAGKAAGSLARKLNQLNLQRQEVELEVKLQAVKQLRETGELPMGIAVWNPDFHTGVIGIVAQRLVETFHRPAAVMGLDSGVYKGSVRGIKGFSVVEALTDLGDLLLKFGGHEGAGGFSIEQARLEEFVESFDAVCRKRLADLEIDPFAFPDTEVDISELTVPLIRELKTFEPFGVGNPGPLLLARNLQVMDIKVLKDAHLKVMLSDGQRYLTGLMWRHTEHPALKPGARVDIAFRPDLNSFNGQQQIQAMLQAIESA